MGMGNETVVERGFERVYLFVHERDLCFVTGSLETVEVAQLVHGTDVELLEEPCDAVLTAGTFFDESEAGAHEISRCALFGADHVGFGDEVSTQQQGQDVRVDLVGFDFGRGDGFEPRGVRKGELDVQVLEEIGEPVPAAGGFDDGFVGSGELGEVPLDAERRVRDAFLIDDGATVVIRCDEGITLMLVDAGIEHGVPSWSVGSASFAGQ